MRMSVRCSYYWKKQSGAAVQFMKCFKNPLNSNKRIPKLYLIIPGNPGCIQFYEKFASILCEKTELPVWGVSHTGHATVIDGMQHPEVELCGLQQQIQHKIDFIIEEVLPHCDKVLLIGHSIGCYVILHVLQRMDNEQIQQGILLFPTIERMRFTPNGKQTTALLNNARWTYSFLATLVHVLPTAVMDCLLPWFVKTKEQCIFDTIKQNINSKVVNCATFMGLQEMFEVHKRDDEIIQKHLDKLVFYYGANDNWCPVSFYKEVFKLYGNRSNNIYLDNLDVAHAFVLNGNLEIANFVAFLNFNQRNT